MKTDALLRAFLQDHAIDRHGFDGFDVERDLGLPDLVVELRQGDWAGSFRVSYREVVSVRAGGGIEPFLRGVAYQVHALADQLQNQAFEDLST